MNAQLRKVILGGALRANKPLLSSTHTLSRSKNARLFFPALQSLSISNRKFSTSGISPKLELTMTEGQITDITGSVANSSTGHEPWGVVQGVQSVLEAVHTTTGLPWWATLLLSGVTLRATIFPFYVLQIQAMQRLLQARPDFMKLYSAYKYARTFIPTSDHKGHINAILLGRQGVKAVMKKYNTRPIQTIVGSVAYIPLFTLMAYSARDMVRSGNFAGFDSGGFSVWMNLIETDSTYVLPILAATSTYANLELSLRTKSGLWTTLLQGGQYITILAVPIIANLPQGVFFYWLGASWSSMAQIIAMSNNNFRRRIGLKPRIVEAQSPAAALKMTSDATEGATVINIVPFEQQQH
ncbi:cytochrome oxidase biogenesis family [Plasmopara halstedii]|uniref:Cytochrome oxidase biogenesis family n=1 Tax=Plasmopara halstedii TaxID=4781 RepID=A0A0N7L8I7_PLAHL|nr:cytochrome oxidase biogenesis family [Plasmopara halstedii]CEG49987.1 cytochrome oxidase biogenesis family [Plasmopara halstedii]|eukprot:XP_024586356.1 cytochrome oxidase biogenesis family [Plasmopara halstedii]